MYQSQFLGKGRVMHGSCLFCLPYNLPTDVLEDPLPRACVRASGDILAIRVTFGDGDLIGQLGYVYILRVSIISYHTTRKLLHT